MNVYLWTKLLHLFWVMVWMATVFVLPVLLLGMGGTGSNTAARQHFVALTVAPHPPIRC